MAGLSLRAVSKSFGRTPVLHRVDLDVPDGEFVVIVGPSGCGKSTLLRLIAGLEDASGGEIRIGGERVDRLPPARRGVAMVFQSYALYPHMTAFENIAFGLKPARGRLAEVDRRVRDAAATLGIAGLLDRRPQDLSGGQRQRVAIGRAIVRDPRVFLFDEPLSNLDATLRAQMRAEIARLQRRLGVTTVHVTHDQVEAMTLADRIVVLREGRVEQVGAPLDLYARPATRFVAGFIGIPSMNFLDVALHGGDGLIRCTLRAGLQIGIPGSLDREAAGGTLGIRPEHLRLAAHGIPARVELTEELGDAHHLFLVLETGERLVARAPGRAPVHAGDLVHLGMDPGRCHLFAPDGRAIARTG